MPRTSGSKSARLIELLERWGAGLTADRVERRMAVRLSRERLRLVAVDDAPQDDVAQLPSLRRLIALDAPSDEDSGPDGRSGLQTAPGAGADQGGDDDEEEECDATFPGDADASIDEADLYTDAWETR